MKFPVYITLASAFFLFFPRLADARIGEGRSSFEGRLFDNGGIIIKDREERGSRRKSGPYTSYLKHLKNPDVRIYFKSDDGRKPTQTDVYENSLGSGWEVHVVFIGGKSMLELYKRVGSISEYELNALLAILGEGAYWKEPEEVEEGEEPPPSAFGFKYVRSDGEVRANKTGGGLMIFQKQLDEYLAKQHESKLAEEAPISVRGF